MNPVKYYGLQVLWRFSGFVAQIPAWRHPKHLFYIVSHERSGTHFLINTIQLNARVRRGYGLGAGAGWGRHNMGEWFGPYDQPEHRFDHINYVNARWSRLSTRAAIIKTHCDRALFEKKYIPAPVIYICRDPRDTLLSWYNYLNQERLYRIHPYMENHQCRSFSEFIRRPASDFLKWNYALEPSFENAVGRWAAHTAGWLGQNDANLHVVRFRDLKRNPKEVLNEIADVLHLELRSGFRSASILGSESMLPQKGVRGAWKDRVSKEDQLFIQDIVERYGLAWDAVADAD